MSKTAATEVPIHDLLTRRWSPRAFSAKAVVSDDLKAMLEAARWAPSCFNEQPWAFIVATKDDAEEYDRLAACLVDANRSWASKAPVLMVGLTHKQFNRNGKPNQLARHDLGIAVAQMTIEAMARDIFVHQMAGILGEKVRETFAVPEDWDVVTGIALGYLGEVTNLPEALAEREMAQGTRKPQNEFVFRGQFGNAAEL